MMMPLLQMEFQLWVSMVKKKEESRKWEGHFTKSKSGDVENYSNIKRHLSLFLCIKPTCSQSVQLNCLLKNETPVLCILDVGSAYKQVIFLST